MAPSNVIDKDAILEGLCFGLDTFPLAHVWESINYFNRTGKLNWLTVVYKYLVYLTLGSYAVLGLSAVYVTEMEMLRRAAAVMNPTCAIQTIVKCWIFTKDIKRYAKLLDFFNKDFISCVPKEKMDEARSLMRDTVLPANMFIRYAVKLNYLVLFMLLWLPLLNLKFVREFLNISSDASGLNKVLDNEYPFDWTNSPEYEFVIYLESMCSILAITTASIYEAILLLLVTALVVHLRVLGFVMSTFKASEFKNGRNERLNDEEKAAAFNKLIECAKNHQKLNQAGTDLADVYDGFLTFNLGTAILIIVIATVGISCSPTIKDSVRFFTMGTFLLSEVSLYCYLGQLLETASQDLSRHIYNSEWEEMNFEYRRISSFMMARTNKSISLKAGRIFPLNLDTLARIQQLVYTAYTVLSRMMSDK